MRRYRLLMLILLCCAGVMLSGCAGVAPWERGVLAKPQMALDPNPLQTGTRMHNYGSREAGAGTNAGGGGGGCGCY